MFRFLVFLLVVLGLGLLFAWAADNPGTIFLQWEWLATKLGRPGEEVGLPLTLAIVLLVGLVAVIMLIASILRGVIGAPSMLSNFFDNRKREKGYKALSQGLIAASSGDVDTARRLTKESTKLLGKEPLVALLGTQTALLEGKREEARTNFESMLDDESTRLVALRGLFLEAERQNAPEAARHYAEEAAKLTPSLPWAGNAKLRYQAGDGDWDASIRTLDANRSAGLIDKTAAKRQRAVLLTAKAISQEQANPDGAKKLAKEAHKLAKELVPAATAFARSASRLGDIKGASKILEAAWKTTPHPELAEAYSMVRPGDSVQDRLNRAQKLAGLKPNHPEGSLAVAIAAIDATEWEVARKALESVLTSHPTERAFLLMADIEEGQHGDQGRMRDWLARAVRAPADPVWIAGNHVSQEWMPISPITGQIDAFEWKTPVEQLGNEAAPVMTLEELHAEAAPMEPAREPEAGDKDDIAQAPVSETPDKPEVEDAIVVAEAAEVEPKIEVEEAETDDTGETETVMTADVAAQPHAPEEEEQMTEPAEVDEVAELEAIDEETAEAQTEADTKPDTEMDKEAEDTPDTDITEPDNDNKADDKEPAGGAKEDIPSYPPAQDNTVEFPLKRRPDDPGPHPDKVPPKKGFKFF